jgi:hypothetical protein
LRLYNIARMFDFNALPDAGGINDQEYQLIEDWQVIRPIDVEGQSEGE